MSLPWRARLVIAVTVLGAGLGAAGVVARFRSDGIGSAWVVAIIAAFILASWLWPIVMYLDTSSQAYHLDEGFFLVLVLTVPANGVLLAFFAATFVAQTVRRRSPVKSVFNLAQLVLSVVASLAVVHMIKPPDLYPIRLIDLPIGLLGASVYFFVNTLAVAVVLAATGAENIVRALFDGFEIRALLFAAALSLGIVCALAISADDWAAIFVGAVFWAFRQTLAGHFRARHDRTRLMGLFDATLDVHRTMGEEEVTNALERTASSLLRSPEAVVYHDEPPAGTMAAHMSIHDDDRWLAVSGRSRSEPFDAADRALLDALGAVGSGALENSSLYEERRRQQESMVAITSSLGEGVCAFDIAGRVTFMNPAAEDLLGLSRGDFNEETESALSAELTFLTAPALRAMRSNTTIRSERSTFIRQNGEPFAVEYTCSPILSDTQIDGAVVAFRDISERIAFEEQLAFHAFHDALTGLPNRRVFLDRLQHALRRSSRTGALHAVLFADVDRFKVANDSLGHQAGDQLLVVISERLRSLIREGDTLARFGGDEFTLLVEDVDGQHDAELVAMKMLDLVREPVVLEGGRTVRVSVSVGIALTSAASSPDDVLHDADVAMYQAKRRGADHYEMFDASAMSSRSADWVDLETELQQALKRNELTVYYQPLFASDTLSITGAEALVRWNHPTRGLLEPLQFIGLAEETGLILPLGTFVLEQACFQAKKWSDLSGTPFKISVNISARRFQADGLVAEIASAVSRSNLEPSQLCLEITETLALQDIEKSISTMSELKSIGVLLAIDDFGTGYSSLNYLKRLPVDVVKLDRTFVQDLDVSPVDTAIAAAVIDLSRTVGMVTVAEGVETEDQLNRLAAMGCPVLQGYLLSRPLSTEAFTEFYTKHLARPLLRSAI